MSRLLTGVNDSNDRFPDTNPTPAQRNFLSPLSRYYGKFTPEQLVFNANLQEFAQRISLLCALETGGKLSPEETYQEIKVLWQNLTESKKQLLDEINRDRPDLSDDS
ncbi:MAG: DUF7219 family protein [Prochlorotrichaceae cyanobacterium]